MPAIFFFFCKHFAIHPSEGLDPELLDASNREAHSTGVAPDVLKSVQAYQPRTILYDESRTLRPAAVALLIGKKENGIILTVRASTLPQHAGQISFPGGALDAGETPEDAALRETEEEIGLARARVTLFGTLDRFQSVSDYMVHSFVGDWEEGELTPSRHEIEKVFTAPLEYFLDPGNCRKEMWNRFGREREMFIWRYDGKLIWGLTARILANFFDVVTGRELSALLPESPSTMAEILATLP